MGAFHWYVLRGYVAFIGLAAFLTLLHRGSKQKPAGGDVRQKSFTYILINLAFLTATWLPQRWHMLPVLLALIGALGSRELSRALHIATAMRWLAPFVSAGLIFSADLLPPLDFVHYWGIVVLILIALNTLVVPRTELASHIILMMGSMVFLPLCLGAYLRVWHLDTTGFLATFLYLTIAANDTFAQIIGQLIGRQQLTPQISPTKTVEGAIGGILFAMIVGVGLSKTVGWTAAHGALAGAITGLAGLIGDLIESKWKRALELKDFSTLLGANGGVLDRFDALIFAAPIFYLLFLH